MSTMSYKNYLASIEYSEEDACFVGRIAGIHDVIGFHADNVAGLREAFHEAVEDYVATCAKIGKVPQKAYSGKVMLRIPPDVHARAATAAQSRGLSLNQFAAQAFMAVS